MKYLGFQMAPFLNNSVPKHTCRESTVSIVERILGFRATNCCLLEPVEDASISLRHTCWNRVIGSVKFSLPVHSCIPLPKVAVNVLIFYSLFFVIILLLYYYYYYYYYHHYHYYKISRQGALILGMCSWAPISSPLHSSCSVSIKTCSRKCMSQDESDKLIHLDSKIKMKAKTWNNMEQIILSTVCSQKSTSRLPSITQRMNHNTPGFAG